ncbi:unnamed protein product [Phyllotreta striolata]|uniref:Reverse transcriptase domain-containing protein n=1 Tax=Phyllotreta striolata TaxID=444603 RepID=A0A9N9TRJ5_PHYSR|nr:unnamed protein product [Phyllotreta striolata]
MLVYLIRRRDLEWKKMKLETRQPMEVTPRRLHNAGKGGHNFKVCKYEKYTCKNCQAVGHLAKVIIVLKNPKCKPVFCKPRTVPFAFKAALDTELNELEKKGVIKLVDNSEWATPLVPVIKEDGKLRICVDYKITENKAYNQLQLTEDTKNNASTPMAG